VSALFLSNRIKLILLVALAAVAAVSGGGFFDNDFRF
jgi:hypothetical protein